MLHCNVIATAMKPQISSLLSAKQQFRAKEAECRRMSTLASLTPERRLEFEKMADYWARLAEAEAEPPWN
jgi:hypothetical protein